jgi:hypothetical protein
MRLNLVSAEVVDGLAVIQFVAEPRDTFAYGTSIRALAQGQIRVTELNEAGSVNALNIQNLSDQFVLFLDGDVLVGAKQDRVLNTPLLLAPRSTTTVPVSCVERGRWHFTTPIFQPAPTAAPPSLRALKAESLAADTPQASAFLADQGRVWAHVAQLKAAMHASAPTDSLAQCFDEKRAHIDQLVHRLQPARDANGLAVWAGRQFLVADVFNRADALTDYFPALTRAVGLDLAAAPTTPAPAQPEALLQVLGTQIESALASSSPPRPGVGVGTLRHLQTPDLAGFVLDYELQRIHLSLAARPLRQRY